jgi:hypothetical protein
MIDTMRGLVFGGLVSLGLLAGYGCSGSDNSQEQVTCGPGTALDGGVCYGVAPAATTADGGILDSGAPSLRDASEAAADAVADAVGSEADGAASRPTFAGVTSVAPASATSLQVTWDSATDRGTPASEIVYDLYVATSAGGESFATPTLTSPPGVASADVGGLVTGSTYYVVVRARDQADGEDENTVEMSGVPQVDSNPPAFAGASGAAPAPQLGITVTWEAAIDDLTPTPGIGYFVYMATTAGAEDFSVPSFVTDPGVTAYLVPALPQPGATYYFVVRAHDAAGNIDANTVEVSAIPGPDTIPPVFAGCTSAVTLNATEVTVAWDPATDNTTPQSEIDYVVYAATASGQEDFLTPSGTFTGVSAGVVTGLKPDTTYYFVCRARDLSNNEDTNTAERAATTPVDTTPPTFAGVTSVMNVTATSAQLTWAAATDPETPTSQIVYDVFQATSPGGEAFSAAPAATSAAGATSIALSDLPPSSTLYWVVRARDLAGNEDTNTVEVTATTGVSFSEDVQPIFSQHCAVVGCHVPGNPPEGQVLAAGFAYSNIVNVPSREVPSDDRVAPGNLAQSYLYQKITAQQSVGSYMPPPSTNDVLMASEIATIKSWILQGALNN